MIGLHYLWYKKFPHSRFHLFNDNAEWLNMDKAGHATTAYNISALQYNTMRWCGINNNRSAWIGGLTALGFQTVIEIFDGFSQKWGFSTGDMLANIVIGIVWKGSPHPIPIPCQKPKFDQLFCLSVLSEFKGSTSNEERPLRFTFATICSILCVQMDQL